jgi:anti-sigma factor RsiW
MTITCEEAQDELRAQERGALAPAAHEAVNRHLASCPACAAVARAEHRLSELLERGLPQFPAPLALKRRLAERWLPEQPAAQPAPRPRPRRGWWLAAAGGTVAAAALAVVLRLGGPPGAPLVAEAINDHLRLLDGERPLQVRSSDLHQVKPWFTGHLDLAPAITFTGDSDFLLEGGAVSRFLETRAASIMFRRRQHLISLFIVHAVDPGWRDIREQPQLTEGRGFGVVLWHRGDLGYALVSDVSTRDLLELQRRITSAPP